MIEEEKMLQGRVQRLTRVFPVPVSKDSISFTRKTRLWCALPYPGHPDGCPNYCKRKNCPEETPVREDMKGIDGRFFLVIAKFDLRSYVGEMAAKHPDWSEKQLRNVLYWQSTVKSMMKRYISATFKDRVELLGAGSGFWDKPSMEAAGINVFKTLMNAGFKVNVDFEVKPINTVTMVALVVTPKERMVQSTL